MPHDVQPLVRMRVHVTVLFHSNKVGGPRTMYEEVALVFAARVIELVSSETDPPNELKGASSILPCGYQQTCANASIHVAINIQL